MTEPSESDYLLGQLHQNAELRCYTLKYKIRMIQTEQIRPLEKELAQAYDELVRITQAYDAMLDRLGTEEEEQA